MTEVGSAVTLPFARLVEHAIDESLSALAGQNVGPYEINPPSCTKLWHFIYRRQPILDGASSGTPNAMIILSILKVRFETGPHLGASEKIKGSI